VDALGRSAGEIAAALDARVTEEQMKKWAAGSPRSWAMESFELARRDVYALPSLPTCRVRGSVPLSPSYETESQKDASAQLLKAAIRMASLLNAALGS
jgi:hypothetical protein